MQDAIPFRTWVPRTPLRTSKTVVKTPKNGSEWSTSDLVRTVEDNAVVVFAVKGCCMGHVVKSLLQTLGADPTIYAVEQHEETRLVVELHRQENVDSVRRIKLPAVFIGGRWFGGLDDIMTAHISGDLTPLLKEAGALWM